MRAAVYYNNNDIRVQEIPVPQIGDGELLIKVIASGICGSDVMEWYRIQKAPLVLGHEIAGEVTQVGKSVKGYRVGDRVFVSHHVPCCDCHYCRNDKETVCQTLRTTNFDPGGFAEYIRIPEINVKNGTFILPDEMSFEEGSFIEPVACVIRGQQKAELKAEQTVLILGSGLSGILHLQLARSLGAKHIVATDVNEYRLQAARRFGADLAIHASEDIDSRLKEINDNRLADLVIICTGSLGAIRQGIQLVEKGGTILVFAPPAPDEEVPINLYNFWRDGISLTTSYAGSPKDITQAIELISSKRINVRDMITHRLGLAETGLGFKLVSRAEDSLKVIIEPQR